MKELSNSDLNSEIRKYWKELTGRNELTRSDVKNGHIRRVVDDEVKSLVLELSGTNVATTYITCPIKQRASLGIKLPFLVMVIKNMKKYFTFEIQILDDKDMHRRFRVSNFQSTTKVRPFCTTMPIGLSSGWNQVQFNLADFTRRAYGSAYIETMRVQIHANIRIRRIYFADKLYGDDEMPTEYRLFLPIPGTQRKQSFPEKEKRSSKETAKATEEPSEEQKEAASVAPPVSPIAEAEAAKEAEAPPEEQKAEATEGEAAAGGEAEHEGGAEAVEEGGGGEEGAEGGEGEAGESEAVAEAGTDEPPTTEGEDESPAEEGGTEPETVEAPDTPAPTEA